MKRRPGPFRRRPVLLLLAGLLAGSATLTLRAARSEAGGADAASITYVKGDAKRAAAKTTAWKELKKGDRLREGDRLRTGAAARLEAKLKDGSLLRLGPNSEMALKTVKVDKKNRAKKKVRAKLFVGRMWAAVTDLFGSDSKFEVETTNAVAGVRGTRFALGRDDAGDTTVKVYSGQVLVSNEPIYKVKGHTKSKRVQVAGPQEVSKKAWEELVASAMQMIRVAQNGEMTKPETFAMTEDDDWERWNTERDKLAGLD